jgi:protein-L-isoaspartate(D-aspartate) O-methyltransferase
MSVITYYYCRRRHHQLLQLQLLVLYFVIITNGVVVSITAFNFNLNDSQNNSNNNNNQRGNNNSNSNSNSNNMKFAWKSRGKNQQDLIQQLRKSGIIRTDFVQQIMEQVDRKNYCYYPTIDSDSDEDVNVDIDEDSSSTISESLCYSDRALSLIKGQTISAPHMHAYVLEEVFPSLIEQYYNIVNSRSTSSSKNDDDDKDKDNNNKNKNELIKILDVGCGSGYLTACFGRFIESLSTTTTTTDTDTTTDSSNDSTSMVAVDNKNNNSRPTIIGKVFGIDIHQDLVDMTRQNLNRQDSDLLLAEGSTSTSTSSSIINLSWGNGWKGLQEEAPFDCIHVGAAAESFPYELMNQLKVNGLMIIPVGSQESPSQPQLLYKIQRIANNNSVVRDYSRSNDDSSSYDDNIYYDEDDFEITTLLGVRYVPLIHDDNDDEDK